MVFSDISILFWEVQTPFKAMVSVHIKLTKQSIRIKNNTKLMHYLWVFKNNIVKCSKYEMNGM